jgi:hypothetical protein
VSGDRGSPHDLPARPGHAARAPRERPSADLIHRQGAAAGAASRRPHVAPSVNPATLPDAPETLEKPIACPVRQSSVPWPRASALQATMTLGAADR